MGKNKEMPRSEERGRQVLTCAYLKLVQVSLILSSSLATK